MVDDYALPGFRPIIKVRLNKNLREDPKLTHQLEHVASLSGGTYYAANSANMYYAFDSIMGGTQFIADVMVGIKLNYHMTISRG